jgi:hypothetical protein
MLHVILAAALMHGVRVQLSFPASVQSTAVTGRVFVVLTTNAKPDPRIQILEPASSPPFFAADISDVRPGQTMVLDASSDSYPLKNINQLPAGDYTAEAFLWKYVEYHRADGHTIWAPEQWGPQIFSLEPGTLYSATTKVHVDPKAGTTLRFTLDKVVTNKDLESLLGGEGYDTDTPWIKHVRMLSPSLTKWWGRPIYLGATILLPKGYAEHPKSHYPVVYNQGHYYQPVPWDFTTDKSTETPQSAAAGKRAGYGTGYEFYEAWNSDNFPRFIMVTWQHPCPFFDDSYAVNTANCGPYGDAIQNELLPFIETRYRVLREARARFTEGGSTGGWESLALMLQHPKFYGGAYVFDPDPIDFSAFQQIDLYQEDNAFYLQTPDDPWHKYTHYFERTPRGQPLCSEEALSQYELVMGSHGRSQYQLDGWWAIFDPIGPDGYPAPMWDMKTGVIDKHVAQYARDHGYDLVAYMKDNWPALGPDLVGKLHFIVGDMDSYYLNLAVYKAEDLLTSLKDPDPKATFQYGRPMKGHGWHPMTWAQLLQEMAQDVRDATPPGVSNAEWNY